MAVLTPAQIQALGLPPKPPPPDVRLINPNGTPTKAFIDYITAVWQWQQRLHTALTT